MKCFFLFICISTSYLVPLQSQTAASSLYSFDFLSAKAEQISFSQGKAAQKIVDELYKIAAAHPEDSTLRWKSIYCETSLHYAQGVYDSTLTPRIQKEWKNINARQYPFYAALLHYAFAVNQFTKGNYGDAFTNALQVTEKFKQLNDSLFTTKSLILLGRVCFQIRSYRIAEDYYAQAKSYANPSQPEYLQACSNIYTTWSRSQRLGEAIDSLSLLTPVLEAKKDTNILAFNYLNIGAMYLMAKNYENAFRYFTAAKKINENIDNERFAISLYQNLGIFYARAGRLGEAYKNFQTAKVLATHSLSPNLMAVTLLSLSYINEDLHHTDSAYYYLKEYTAVNRKLEDNASLIDAYQAYVAMFLEASKNEIIIKEQEIMLHNRRFILAMIVAVGVILIIILFLIILFQQKRNMRQQSLLKEAENRDLEKRLQAEQQLQQLQEERIELQLRELTSYSLALSAKNDLLQQISTSVKKTPNEKTALSEIQQIIKTNLNTDKAWDDFVLHFEKVHPYFFQQLKSFCPDFSDNDLRLCAYFRLGLSTKQIAQILNIIPESIKTHRHRMKKKLGLGKDENLDDFIRNIDIMNKA